MKIAQIVPTLRTGGAEKVAVLLARELVGMGHAVRVVVLGEACGGALEEALGGIEVDFLGKRPGLDLRIVPRLRAAAREVDLVHTHLHVLKYLLPQRRPVVHTLHNLAEREATALDRRVQWAAFRAGVVPVAIGRAVAESVERVYGVAGPVVENGIPIGELAVEEGVREEARAELRLSGTVWLAVGRLDEQKDHASLLRAVAGLPVTLLIAGEGPLRAALAAEAPSNVRLLGLRSDVPRLLAAADGFVLSSRWEGNPLSVMEAMAAGRPVVATAVGCVPELVGEYCGRLVPPGEAGELRAALSGLSGDPDAMRAAGKRAAVEARARFDVPVMARGYAELYERLLRGS